MPKISKVIIYEETRPVIVDFQNGKIEPGQERNLKSALYKNRENKTVVSVANTSGYNDMVYTGTVNNEDDLLENFLVIHNKRTNKIRLVQVDCCTLSPLFEDKSETVDGSPISKENSAAELKKQFGSKRTKRQTEQQERLKMNIDAVKDELEKTVTDIKIKEIVATQTDDNLVTPKINRDASTKEQVYNLEDLIPENLLDVLEENTITTLNTDLESESQEQLLPFVASSIFDIKQAPISNDVKVHKCKLLLYVNYLIKFLSTQARLINKFSDCPNVIANHIRNNFAVKGEKVWLRPLYMKDKLLCYILVISMIALDFKLNIEKLVIDLKTGVKKILEISRILAFSQTSNKNILTLKIPLPAPITFTTKRKRNIS